MTQTYRPDRNRLGGGARRKGFTLIELLVVIAIIAILAAILFPVFSKARAKARSATCVSNLKQYSLAIIMYCGDHDGFGPYNTCGHFVPRRLDQGGYGPREDSVVYSCPERGSYGMNGYRGGNCIYPRCGSTPWNLEYNGCGAVKHPEAVMLVADARSPLVPGGPAGQAYFYDLDGRMTPRHHSVNNLAFCDGHVKGYSPNWLLNELVQGDADSNGDGVSDGNVTGQGSWYVWTR